MKHIIAHLVAFSFICATAVSQTVQYETDPTTGAVKKISIANDGRDMNWIMNVDGSQYAWVTDKYGWGLGYLTEMVAGKTNTHSWHKPSSIKNNGNLVSYVAGNIRVDVKRELNNGGLSEEYTFTNTGKQPVSLTNVGIYTPFNDNCPSSQASIRSRTHAHIWDGGNAAYINATHMGANPPHMGLAVTIGSIKSYEIWERGRDKENSHTRGVISLNLPDTDLKPGEKMSIGWHIFSHTGWDDFHGKLVENGSIVAKSNQYIFEKGDTARVEILANPRPAGQISVDLNGTDIPVKKESDKWVAETIAEESGAMRFNIRYGNNKETHIDCFVYESFDKLIAERVRFIIDKQQYNNPSNAKNGAYMVFDNETDEIYHNNTPNANPPDRDEGAERLGMGVLLAKQYLLTQDEKIKESLLTGDKQFAIDGYGTMRSMFRQFGYNFYAIGTPIQTGLSALKDGELNEFYNILLDDYKKMCDKYIANGLNYPSSEVNYEQAIVGPTIVSLTELYLATGENKYLEEAKRQMPVLEAFNGYQPSYHLNEIAIRHWDGYWFGKREMWGDTFPHYWSTITAMAYHNYYLCTNDVTYQQRAENIVRNNLCLFFEDGSASCAYLYPSKVDNVEAQFYDPYANDQDWSLVNYLMINENK